MKKTILFIILVAFVISCTKEEPLVNEENNVAIRELQPFAAWLRTPSSATRSSSGMSELIINEQEKFEEKFAYINQYFKVTLSPRWSNPQIIQHDEQTFDAFILCDNTDTDKEFLNDFVLIISKRKGEITSYIKMLAGDESINNRLIATYKNDKVYLELEQIEANGAIISQGLGHLVYSETATTRCNCWFELYPITTKYLVLDKEGGGGYSYSITRYESKLVCDGTIDGITTPPPGSGAGGIPPYTPPTYPPPSTGGSGGTGGSSGNNNSSGNNGSYNGAGYGTGTGGNYTGGGRNSGGPGGSGASGCPECDKPIPDLPPGGMDFMPPSSNGGGAGPGTPAPPPATKPQSDLPKKKPKEILEDCNDIIRTLKNALKGNNDTFINFQSPYDDKTKFPSYSDYLAKIQSDPTREYSISLKYYPDNNEYITNAIHTGDAYNVAISTDNRTIANIHNHPTNIPPSPRDMKTMLGNVFDSPNYQALYTLTPDGTYYAFYVTDRAKAINFWNNYKDKMVIGTDNHFEKKTEFWTNWENGRENFKKLGKEDAWNYALAYLMDKYDMGVGLFRQKKGKAGFTSLHMKKDANGIYQVVKCK